MSTLDSLMVSNMGVKMSWGGTWVAQSVEHLTLAFGSGPGCGIWTPCGALCWTRSLLGILSLPLLLFPGHSLRLKWIQMKNNKKMNWVMFKIHELTRNTVEATQLFNELRMFSVEQSLASLHVGHVAFRPWNGVLLAQETIWVQLGQMRPVAWIPL